MNTSPKDLLIGLLALTTLGGGAVAWHQHGKVLQLQAIANEAAAERAEWESRMATVDRIDEGFGDPFPLPVTTAAEDPSGAVPEQARDARQMPQREEVRNRGGRNEAMATLMQTPEFARALVVQQKSALDARYADLFRQLNLPPETIDRFKDLLLERQSANADVMAAAREQGLGGQEDRAALRLLVEQTQAETDAAIRATLGEAGYAEYQFYNQSQPQRAVVSQLENKLSYGGAPLAQSQSDQLVRILAESASTQAGSTRSGRGGGGFGGRGSAPTGGTTVTDEALARAQSILSSPQLEALKQLQAEQQAQQAMSEAIRSTMGNRTRGNVRGNRTTAPAQATGNP